MRLKIKALEFLAGRPVAILNAHTANEINVHVDERIKISNNGKSVISVIDTAVGMIRPREIVVSAEIIESLEVKKGDYVEVSLAQEPESKLFIQKKLKCFPLNKSEIECIVKDIVKNALTETEIAYFVSGIYKCGMSHRETEYLVKAMVDVGDRLHFKGKVVDKHSIGGVAGNRTTPIVVAICAAVGLIIPKTSSRAITSAAGTADVIESIARVEFKKEKIRDIIKKTNGCMVWGGSLCLSPADDKLIQVERILHLDPEPQLLASVLSKKIAVGSKYVLIDIPFGHYAKVSRQKGLDLKRKFESLGKEFGLKLKCVLTNGNEPIGHGIGPLLEIRDVISILKRDAKCPKDLEKKAVFLAGTLLELCGKAKKNQGGKMASQILESGLAFKKFKQIIIAQGGKVPEKFKLGRFSYTLNAIKNSKVKKIDNRKMNLLAVLAGSPMDKGAGSYLYKHVGDKIKKGEPLLTIYAESKIRLNEAINLYKKKYPIKY